MSVSSDRAFGSGAAALGFILAAMLSTPALAQSFVGDWKATAHVGAGQDATETVHVMKAGDGYLITAKLNDAAPGTPEAGPGTDIVIDGDKFSYSRSVTTPNGALVVKYSGVVSGDAFTGQVELLGNKIPYTGERIRSGQ
jgi:hypothetical protein